MKTVHIQDYISNLSINDKLSDNYNLDVSFSFEEPSSETIENCFIRMYFCTEKCSLDDAMEGWMKKVLGSLILEGQLVGYSEYTITGFNVIQARIGGHDLQDIVKKNAGTFSYVHILIDKVEA